MLQFIFILRFRWLVLSIVISPSNHPSHTPGEWKKTPVQNNLLDWSLKNHSLVPDTLKVSQKTLGKKEPGLFDLEKRKRDYWTHCTLCICPHMTVDYGEECRTEIKNGVQTSLNILWFFQNSFYWSRWTWLVMKGMNVINKVGWRQIFQSWSTPRTFPYFTYILWLPRVLSPLPVALASRRHLPMEFEDCLLPEDSHR